MPLEGNQGLNPHRDAEQRRFRSSHPDLEIDPNLPETTLIDIRQWAKAKRLQDQQLEDDKAASNPKRMRVLNEGARNQGGIREQWDPFSMMETEPEDPFDYSDVWAHVAPPGNDALARPVLDTKLPNWGRR